MPGPDDLLIIDIGGFVETTPLDFEPFRVSSDVCATYRLPLSLGNSSERRHARPVAVSPRLRPSKQLEDTSSSRFGCPTAIKGRALGCPAAQQYWPRPGKPAPNRVS